MLLAGYVLPLAGYSISFWESLELHLRSKNGRCSWLNVFIPQPRTQCHQVHTAALAEHLLALNMRGYSLLLQIKCGLQCWEQSLNLIVQIMHCTHNPVQWFIVPYNESMRMLLTDQLPKRVKCQKPGARIPSHIQFNQQPENNSIPLKY